MFKGGDSPESKTKRERLRSALFRQKKKINYIIKLYEGNNTYLFIYTKRPTHE